MLIVQATRILTEVHLSMFAKINWDHLGNPREPVTVGLSSCDIDGTGALTEVDLLQAFKYLLYRGERTLGEDYASSWHDTL